MNPSLEEVALRDVSDAFYSRCTTIAGVCLLSYDTFLTLGDEVRQRSQSLLI